MGTERHFDTVNEGVMRLYTWYNRLMIFAHHLDSSYQVYKNNTMSNRFFLN